MSSLSIKVKLFVIAYTAVFLMGASQFSLANPIPEIPQIPAFLPLASSVPEAEQYPIDGEWMINQIGKRIRIEKGRAYAVDPWLHLFVLKIQPLMVVIKDINRNGRGEYTGQDLPLAGKWTGTLTSSGTMNVHVAGAFGPVSLTLSPVDMDDQDAFDDERSAHGGGDDDVYPDDTDDGSDHYEEDIDEESIDEEDGEELEDEGGEELDEEIKATSHQLYSCKGKGIYYSKVNGVKACYTCPKGFTRYSPTRKMNHKKACTKRQPGKNEYAKASKKGNIKKCSQGQFKHKGRCKSCPDGYTPIYNTEVSMGIKFYTGQCRIAEE